MTMIRGGAMICMCRLRPQPCRGTILILVWLACIIFYQSRSSVRRDTLFSWRGWEPSFMNRDFMTTLSIWPMWVAIVFSDYFLFYLFSFPLLCILLFISLIDNFANVHFMKRRVITTCWCYIYAIKRDNNNASNSARHIIIIQLPPNAELCINGVIWTVYIFHTRHNYHLHLLYKQYIPA